MNPDPSKPDNLNPESNLGSPYPQQPNPAEVSNTGATTPLPSVPYTPDPNAGTKKTLLIVGIVFGILAFLGLCCAIGSVLFVRSLDLDRIDQHIERDFERRDSEILDPPRPLPEPTLGEIELAELGFLSIPWNGSDTFDGVTFGMDASNPASILIKIENNSDFDVDISAIMVNGWGMLSDSYDDLGFTYTVAGSSGLTIPPGETTTVTLIPDDGEQAIGIFIPFEEAESDLGLGYSIIYFGTLTDIWRLLEDLPLDF